MRAHRTADRVPGGESRQARMTEICAVALVLMLASSLPLPRRVRPCRQNIEAMERIGSKLIVARHSFYHILDLVTGEATTLPSYENRRPLITWMQDNEVRLWQSAIWQATSASQRPTAGCPFFFPAGAHRYRDGGLVHGHAHLLRGRSHLPPDPMGRAPGRGGLPPPLRCHAPPR
jgi:hypothetical protein